MFTFKKVGQSNKNKAFFGNNMIKLHKNKAIHYNSLRQNSMFVLLFAKEGSPLNHRPLFQNFQAIQ